MEKIIEFIKRVLIALFGSKSLVDGVSSNVKLYKAKSFFFSKAENNFYQVLRSVVGDSYVIFAKIRILDILDVVVKDGRQSALNRINRKHVDYLLCSNDYFNPLLAIELDDSSHKKQTRQQRDEFLNDIFSSSGLPLLRVPVQRVYNVSELKESIQKAIDFK